MHLIEYALDIYVPEHIWESQIWQNLLKEASTYSVYNNDLYSFEKELNENKGNLDLMANCVSVISLLDGIPIEEAMQKLVKLMADKEEEVFKIENEIMNKEDCLPLVKTYIESINYMMGCLSMTHTYCDRYNKFNY